MIFNQVIAGFKPWTSSTGARRLSHLSSPSYILFLTILILSLIPAFRYKMMGGCTVIVSLFILGKLYVANAGDSRGVLCRNKIPYPMSFDFTPVSERQRLQQLGFQKPQLLGKKPKKCSVFKKKDI